MVKINEIELKNFRNFKNNKFLFNSKSNIFYGNNGSGKTNILESVSIIGKGRGIRNANISDLIKNKEENFLIKSMLEINNNNYDVQVYTKQVGNKINKIISVNNDQSSESKNILKSKLSYLIFLPEMERLFQSSPSYRRNFIDRLIFSEKNDYNKLINKYKKNILERNKILQNNKYDLDWIKILENEICNIGLEIYKLRKIKLEHLNNHIKKINKYNNYGIDINLQIKDTFYNNELSQDTYLRHLVNSREFDGKYGGVKIGPHKSDIIATINSDYDASQLSTGQQKTLVLMLLIAQCDFLVNIKNVTPILLFDEICSHLDSNNRQILLDMINQFDIQLFLTGTDRTLFSFISTNVEFYNITNI